MTFFKKETKKPLSVVLVQGSMNDHCKTAILIEEVDRRLQTQGVVTTLVDFRAVDIDFCNGRKLEEYNDDTRAVYAVLAGADAYVFGMPVYSYTISGTLKNLIDITAPALSNKIAGIICNSHGVRSYLASIDLQHVLGHKAAVRTIQPIIHTSEDSFKGGQIFEEQIFDLMDELIDGLKKQVRIT